MNPLAKTLPLAACAIVAALALAPIAGAKIVPNKSIGGVSLNQSYASVTDKLGTGGGAQFGDEPSDYQIIYEKLGLSVSWLSGLEEGAETVEPLPDDKVFFLNTTSTKERDSKGVGPGVTSRTAKRRLIGEKCSKIFDADRRVEVEQCVTNKMGKVSTTYVLRKGKVLEVSMNNIDF